MTALKTFRTRWKFDIKYV